MRILTFIVLIFLVTSCATTEKHYQKHVLVGQWEGAWDNTWKTEFKIVQKGPSKFRFTYKWVEILGRSMRSDISTAYVLNESSIKSGNITITIDEQNPNRAIAYGDFPKPRTAILEKVNNKATK